MESDNFVITSLVSIVLGFVSSWLFFQNQRSREKKIRQKIADLEYEAKVLDSISNGYKNLLIYSFKHIAFSMALFISALGLLIFSIAVTIPVYIEQIILGVGFAMCAMGAFISFDLLKTLMSLHNKDKSKERLLKKIGGLQQKLKT